MILPVSLLCLIPGLLSPTTSQTTHVVKLSLAADFSIELQATWEQLTGTVYKFERTHALFQDFQPARERELYDAQAFRPFLSQVPVAVGDVWKLDPKHALPFLKQLHPGATERLHHGGGTRVSAPGAWACLRMLSPTHAEVMIRVHADFLMDGDGTIGQSSWLTPAQFEGRILIDLERRVVSAFKLALPHQSANVDLNMSTGMGISADIGRIPRMELSGGEALDRAATAATEQIGLERARSLLARKFYPVAEVEWLDLERALAQARASNKPLHIVALFGSLLDESC